MSIRALAYAFDVKVGDPLAKLVLLAVADHINESTGDAWPSVDRLAAMTDSSRRTVIRKLGKLEEMGLIKRTKRYNKTDLYVVVGASLTPTTSVTQSPLEVPERHTNHNITNINKKGETKLIDWEPCADAKKYASDHGVNWSMVWEDIKLWNEQSGNKKAYVSCLAFWQRWVRSEAQKPKAKAQQKRYNNDTPIAINNGKKMYTQAEFDALTDSMKNHVMLNRPDVVKALGLSRFN